MLLYYDSIYLSYVAADELNAFIWLMILSGSYFGGRACIMRTLKNLRRAYYLGRFYFQGNTVLVFSVFAVCKGRMTCEEFCQKKPEKLTAELLHGGTKNSPPPPFFLVDVWTSSGAVAAMLALWEKEQDENRARCPGQWTRDKRSQYHHSQASVYKRSLNMLI